ncbi:hypothetical protein [Paenibacillus sp. SI8]|uniref:hypothetical protein n=1 Tax=unclassified Paenibacillus TaxID=185978 RepID=UPI003467E109
MGYTCLVCNYRDLEDPPYDTRGFGSFEICICCGFQYGFHDDGNNKNPQVLEVWRKKWVEKGYKWHSSYRLPPSNWDAKKQLNGLSD